MASKKIWYVESNVHTNEVIAREFPDAISHIGVLCRDGKKRNFWECDWGFISKLVKNQREGQFAFSVFYRERPYAPVKPWPFLRKRRMTLASVLKEGTVKRGSSTPKASRPAT